jgi:hypothetical protein
MQDPLLLTAQVQQESQDVALFPTSRRSYVEHPASLLGRAPSATTPVGDGPPHAPHHAAMANQPTPLAAVWHRARAHEAGRAPSIGRLEL